MIDETLKPVIQEIRMILLDVDGVLTSGEIIYTENGDEIKAFDIQDGMGITLARWGGLKTGILTGRNSQIVERRARELKFDAVYMGAFRKTNCYEDILKNYNLSDSHVCYMGDDFLDLPILERVGLPAAPANARIEVKQTARIVTEATGGHGAVRELIELILKVQGKWEFVLNKSKEKE